MNFLSCPFSCFYFSICFERQLCRTVNLCWKLFAFSSWNISLKNLWPFKVCVEICALILMDLLFYVTFLAFLWQFLRFSFCWILGILTKTCHENVLLFSLGMLLCKPRLSVDWSLSLYLENIMTSINIFLSHIGCLSFYITIVTLKLIILALSSRCCVNFSVPL